MTCRIICGDAAAELARLPSDSVQCCVTSPPYWGLRDYGVAGQLGLERTPEEYVARMTAVFREVRRVLRADGTAWVNMGDSYAGGKTGNTNGGPSSGLKNDGRPESSRQKTNDAFQADMKSMQFRKDLPPSLKPKDLCGIPWRLAFALQADGWYLRSDIIWHKPNPMPESVQDRPTKAHEYIFLLTKQPRYYFDQEAVREPHSFNRWSDRSKQDCSVLAGAMNGQAGKTSLLRKGEGKDWFPNGGRNIRSVWTIMPHPFRGAHFATFPPALVDRCLRAGSRHGDLVLDPFAGSGTVGLVCKQTGRDFIGIELNPEYCRMARGRIGNTTPALSVNARPRTT